MGMRFVVYVVLVVCFTLQDLQNEGCKALCQRDGFSSGQVIKTQCVCFEEKGTYEDFKYRRTIVPRMEEPVMTVTIPDEKKSEPRWSWP